MNKVSKFILWIVLLIGVSLIIHLTAPQLTVTEHTATTEKGLQLELPIDCDYGRDCFIQNYFDHDPSPQCRDFQGGSLCYDGHTGTDFRISWADYVKGVPVLAAADGVVLNIRNTEPDIDVRQRQSSVKGKEAGNGVVIDHGDGYHTQYSHLKRGSIKVKPGDRVTASQPIGLVGLSGQTEFPHLELAVRLDKKSLCPFAPDDLWSDEADRELKYLPTGPLAAGFSIERPKLPDVLRKIRQPEIIESNSPIMIFWASFYGTQKDDLIHLEMIAPDGKTMTQKTSAMPKAQAQRLQYIGKRQRTGQWPSGVYTGRCSLTRNGNELFNLERRITVP